MNFECSLDWDSESFRDYPEIIDIVRSFVGRFDCPKDFVRIRDSKIPKDFAGDPNPFLILHHWRLTFYYKKFYFNFLEKLINFLLNFYYLINRIY